MGIVRRPRQLGSIVRRTNVYVLKGLLTIGLLLMAFTMVMQVFYRYVLGVPLFGFEELVLIVAVWVYFLGAGYATYEGTHIKAGVLPYIVKNHIAREAIGAGAVFLSLVASVLLTYNAFGYNQFVHAAGARTTSLFIPIVYSTSSLVVGGAIMSLYFLLELLGKIQMWGKNKKVV